MADQPYYGDKYIGKPGDYDKTDPISPENSKKIRDILKRIKDRKKAGRFQNPNTA